MKSYYTSLYYFIVTVDEMNFTRAAERLFISQQALSKHIQKLESQYEVVFFQRGPHLRLTQAGEYMYRFAKSVVGQEQSLHNFLSHQSVNSKIKLNLGISSHKGHILLPYVLRDFKEKYPNVVPTVLDGNAAYMDHLLQSGQVDVYFCMRQNEQANGLFTSLQDDNLYFVLNEQLLSEYCGESISQYICKFANGINAEEISRFPITFPNPDTSLRTTLNAYFEAAGSVPNIYAETNNYFTMYRLMANGQCGSFVSKVFLYDIQCNFSPRECPIIPFQIKGLPALSSLNVVIDPHNAADRFYQDFIQCAKNASNYVNEQTELYLTSQFSGF